MTPFGGRCPEQTSPGSRADKLRIGGGISDVFGPAGPVARLLGSSYRPRSGQVEMARVVLEALEKGHHALVEAGTGSGKSFAYLIPLIWTRRRAFISTANKTLQNQLWEKDLPALQAIAPQPFKAALLKGRSNYVCRTKLKEAQQQLRLPHQGYSVADVVDCLEEKGSGDVEELRLFGEPRDLLTVGRNECLGQRCPHQRRCYYEQARLAAEQADIVVLNHALLAFNLVLEGQIVDPRDTIVIDEAHDFVPYVIGALSLHLAYDRVPALVSDDVVIANADDGMRTRALRLNHDLFTELAAGGAQCDHRWPAPQDLPTARKLAQQVQRIHGQLSVRCPSVPGVGTVDESDAREQAAVEWAAGLSQEIAALGHPVPDNMVRYCERGTGSRDETSAIVCQEPLGVSAFLREQVWEATKTVICTSGTLTVGRAFDHFRRQTGAPESSLTQRIIPGPFDYGEQALLYTPEGLDPRYGAREGEYVGALAVEVERLVNAARGRTFVLCTSTRRVDQLFGLLEERLAFTCYRQGMASREELLELFRSDGDGAVLIATRSFWQGVDVPGPSLSLVIIDKLPFAPWTDPVVAARQRRAKDVGGDPFRDDALPEAIIALKQGVGRLIRAETDRGVIAILDSRVNTKSYGARVIASLPPARRTTAFGDVLDFFAEGR